MNVKSIALKTIAIAAFVLAASCGSPNDEKREDSAPGQSESAVKTETVLAATPVCDYSGNSYLIVAEKDFATRCMAPRKDPADTVRIPLDAGQFVSQCEVTLGPVDEPNPGNECVANDTVKAKPLATNDRMMITDEGNGKYLLTRTRGTEKVVVSMTAADPFGDGTPYLSGDLAGVTYVVYIQYRLPDANGEFEKFYRFEVFDSDSKIPAKCEEHKPTKPTLEDCAVGAGTTGSQTGTSTGGEPPVN